jgi:hypothetical protein
VTPSATYWEAPTGDLKLLTTRFRETFHDIIAPESDNPEYQFTYVVLPYLPYFSNCYGFDSYMPLWSLMEDTRQCTLPQYSADDPDRDQFPSIPQPDDVQVVGPLDILTMPISDACHREMRCAYEEILDNPDAIPRWFEVSEGEELFKIIRRPVTLSEMQTNGNVVEDVLDTEGVDGLISVQVDRSAADTDVIGICAEMCVPRVVTLDMPYYQETITVRRLISATLVFSGFDRDISNSEYSFQVDWYPLNYIDIVIAFAFPKWYYIMLFFIVGGVTLLVTIIFWAINRCCSQLRRPPRLKFFTSLSLTANASLAGFLLPTIPMAIIVGAFYFAIYGGKMLRGRRDRQFWLLDSWAQKYTDIRVDTGKIAETRSGRVGLGFLVMGVYLLFLGSRMLLPRLQTKYEDSIKRSRDYVAAMRSIWTPTQWRRAHLIFVALIYCFFLAFCIELSFWSSFGENIYIFIVLLKLVSIFADQVIQLSLRDIALGGPLTAMMAIVQGFVTLGAPDFKEFLISFAVDLTMAYADYVYYGPLAEKLADWVKRNIIRFIEGIRRAVLRKKTVVVSEEEKKRQEEKKVKIARVIKATNAVKAGTIETIIDAAQAYTTDLISRQHLPLLIILFILFRDDIGIPLKYNIREADMEYYLWFSVIVLAFMYFSDQFLLNTFEAVWGRKLHDYLVYARFRFLKRERRWKTMEGRLDEMLEDSHRLVDASCFSSQYYMSVYVFAQGMFFVNLAIVIFNNAAYNAFADPATPLVLGIVLLLCVLLHWASVKVGNLFRMWIVKEDLDKVWKSTMGDGKDETFGIPGMEDIDKLKALAEAASTEQFLINQRMSSEVFRWKFLKHNRQWLLERLPLIFTPRTMRRARPYLLSQFAKLLGIDEDESDDEGDGYGVAGGKAKDKSVDPSKNFGPVDLSGSSRRVLMWWLGEARRRARLKKAVEMLGLRFQKMECELCQSKNQLSVEPTLPIDPICEKFEQENPAQKEDLNVNLWREYYTNQQQFRTICAACKAKRDDQIRGMKRSAGEFADRNAPKFSNVVLNAASEAILRDWYRKAQRKLQASRGQPRARPSASPNFDQRRASLAPSVSASFAPNAGPRSPPPGAFMPPPPSAPPGFGPGPLPGGTPLPMPPGMARGMPLAPAGGPGGTLGGLPALPGGQRPGALPFPPVPVGGPPPFGAPPMSPPPVAPGVNRPLPPSASLSPGMPPLPGAVPGGPESIAQNWMDKARAGAGPGGPGGPPSGPPPGLPLGLPPRGLAPPRGLPGLPSLQARPTLGALPALPSVRPRL